MTFERWNILARTFFLGFLTCVLALFVLQASGVLKGAQHDAHGLTGQAGDLLKAGKAFIPTKTLDIDKVNGVVSSAQGVVNDARTSLRLMNRPCVPGPCGLLADGAKTLNTARMTMGKAEIAADHEDKNLATLDKQEATIYAGANDDLQALHALLAAPDLLQTMHNLDTTSAAVADSAAQADGTLKDVHDEVHKLTHPPAKKVTFWGAIFGVGQKIQKLSPPLF